MRGAKFIGKQRTRTPATRDRTAGVALGISFHAVGEPAEWLLGEPADIDETRERANANKILLRTLGPSRDFRLSGIPGPNAAELDR